MVLKRAIKKEIRESEYYGRESDTNDSGNSSNKKSNGLSGGEIFGIIASITICLIFIVGLLNNSNNSSSSYNYSYTNDKDSYEKNGKCRGNDGYWHEKPVHGYCDGGDTPLGRKCNAGYYAKSENNLTYINSSWYCAANCENFSCKGYGIIPCTFEESAIPSYYNSYSQTSIDNYNRKIEAYNRCLSEKCSCAY